MCIWAHVSLSWQSGEDEWLCDLMFIFQFWSASSLPFQIFHLVLHPWKLTPVDRIIGAALPGDFLLGSVNRESLEGDMSPLCFIHCYGLRHSHMPPPSLSSSDNSIPPFFTFPLTCWTGSPCWWSLDTSPIPDFLFPVHISVNNPFTEVSSAEHPEGNCFYPCLIGNFLFLKSFLFSFSFFLKLSNRETNLLLPVLV